MTELISLLILENLSRERQFFPTLVTACSILIGQKMLLSAWTKRRKFGKRNLNSVGLNDNSGKYVQELSMSKECQDASKGVMYLTDKLYLGDDSKAASTLFGVAEAYGLFGECNEAVSMFEECKELIKRASSSSHLELATVMQRLAKLHENFGTLEKASLNHTEAF